MNEATIRAAGLYPLDDWAGQCHAASLKIVRSDVLGPSRVARGGCKGVFGQHSWVVLGHDCYDENATIVDPTLWSYVSDVVGVWVGTYLDELHVPHGRGSIWDWGRPREPEDEVVELTPRQPWSSFAQSFLELLGPLDETGWKQLAHAPVEGWPAGEILLAIYDRWPHMTPIDRIGMLTDENPRGLYLKGDE